MSEVSALILNWNGAPDAIECASSLRGSSYQDFQYTVVDNGSTDDSLVQLRRALGTDHVSSVGRNKGYAGGMNEAIELWLRTDARFGLLLTQDARLEPETLGILVGMLASEPGLGIIGPVILNRRNGSIFSAGGYIRRHGRQITQRPLDSGNQAAGPPPAVDRVQWVDGCCFLVRREVVESVGRFDERFFLYVEEVDLCHRASRAGWEIGVARAARASQTPGDISSGRAREYYLLRNKILFCRKHFGRRAAVLAALSYLYWTVLPLHGARRSVRTASRLIWGLAGMIHGLMGRSGQMPKWLA
ncbi:MAG TPA: glycosyltransferase family 2 protein [bacterium]|nr:glycosyltransferase family 2 protein [bacterium]